MWRLLPSKSENLSHTQADELQRTANNRLLEFIYSHKIVEKYTIRNYQVKKTKYKTKQYKKDCYHNSDIVTIKEIQIHVGLMMLIYTLAPKCIATLLHYKERRQTEMHNAVNSDQQQCVLTSIGVS